MHYTEELYHHGILGQKWGVRRFQNEDGSLTNLGQKRYAKTMGSKHRQKRDTKDAKKVLKSEAVGALTGYANTKKKIEKFNNKLNKAQYLEKTDKIDKYKNKLSDAKERNSQYKKLAKHYQDELGKVKDGTLKAGKDFFIGRTTWAVPVATGHGVYLLLEREKDYIKINK